MTATITPTTTTPTTLRLDSPTASTSPRSSRSLDSMSSRETSPPSPTDVVAVNGRPPAAVALLTAGLCALTRSPAARSWVAHRRAVEGFREQSLWLRLADHRRSCGAPTGRRQPPELAPSGAHSTGATAAGGSGAGGAGHEGAEDEGQQVGSPRPPAVEGVTRLGLEHPEDGDGQQDHAGPDEDRARHPEGGETAQALDGLDGLLLG